MPERLTALIFGLPALTSLLAVAGITVAACQRSHDLAEHYLVHAYRYARSGELEIAELCVAAAIDHGAEPDQARFQLALAAADGGSVERAWSMMRTLAPLDRRAHGAAHAWLGQRLLARGQLERGEIELRRAVEAEPSNSDAHRGLVRALERLGRFEACAPIARAAHDAGHIRTSRLLLFYQRWVARLPRGRGRQRLLDAGRQIAHELLRQPADRDADELRAPDLDRVAARLFLGEHARVVQSLSLPDTARRHRVLLALTYRRWAETTDQDRAVGLLEAGLELTPFDHRAVTPLLRLRHRASARAVLAQHLGGGPRHRAAHGAALLAIGRPRGALAHLERAYARLGPADVACASNLSLALCRCHDDRRQLARALVLIDDAIRRHPTARRLRDTRGRVLARLGRWRQALRALEAGLPALRSAERPEGLRAISRCYAALGDAALARAYRRRAAER